MSELWEGIGCEILVNYAAETGLLSERIIRPVWRVYSEHFDIEQYNTEMLNTSTINIPKLGLSCDN